jgi:cyclophilin family peptidyl-prolyl cis-trans isomerase
MSPRKLTVKKREELRRQREKEMRRSGNFSGLIIIVITVIILIVAVYFLFLTGGENGTTVVNTTPVASDDYPVVDKNSAQVEIDILANDADRDGDTLTLTNIGDPSNGYTEIIDGILYYTPTSDFTGIDTFECTIEDGNGGTTTSTAHVIVVDPEENPIALIDTSVGMIIAELYEDKVPITAGNFINLSNDGFYDGLIFHRVIPSFMIQGGCPYGTGTGGPGYTIPDEFHEDLSNVRGTFSMANSGPDSGGSQFFINVVDNTHLDYDKDPLTSKHAVFGVVIDGIDVADEISEVSTNEADKPLQDVTINSIIIENN